MPRTPLREDKDDVDDDVDNKKKRNSAKKEKRKKSSGDEEDSDAPTAPTAASAFDPSALSVRPSDVLDDKGNVDFRLMKRFYDYGIMASEAKIEEDLIELKREFDYFVRKKRQYTGLRQGLLLCYLHAAAKLGFLDHIDFVLRKSQAFDVNLEPDRATVEKCLNACLERDPPEPQLALQWAEMLLPEGDGMSSEVLKSFVCSSIRIGDMEGAVQMLEDNLSETNGMESFTTLVHTFAEDGNLEMAEETVAWMLENGYVPSHEILVSILSIYSRAGSLKHGEKWLGVMHHHGVLKKSDPAEMSVQAANNGDIKLALRLAQLASDMDADSPEMYSALIRAHSRVFDYESAETCMAKFQTMYPRAASKEDFANVISTCAHHGLTDRCDRWMSRMRQAGYELDNRIYEAFLKSCCVSGDLRKGERYLNSMLESESGPRLDIGVFEQILLLMSQRKSPRRLTFWVEKMEKAGVDHSESTLTTLLKWHSLHGDLEEMDRYAEKMLAEKMDIAAETFGVLVKAWINAKECPHPDKLEKADYYVELMIERNISLEGCIHALMQACYFCKDDDKGHKYLTALVGNGGAIDNKLSHMIHTWGSSKLTALLKTSGRRDKR